MRTSPWGPPRLQDGGAPGGGPRPSGRPSTLAHLAAPARLFLQGPPALRRRPPPQNGVDPQRKDAQLLRAILQCRQRLFGGAAGDQQANAVPGAQPPAGAGVFPARSGPPAGKRNSPASRSRSQGPNGGQPSRRYTGKAMVEGYPHGRSAAGRPVSVGKGVGISWLLVTMD